MSTEDRPQVPISLFQFAREAWWAGSLLAMWQYKVASVLLPIGTLCGIFYWWYCDQQWSLSYGWAAGLLTGAAGGFIISDWFRDARRILRETRGQSEDVHAVSASVAGIFVVFTVSVVTLIWGPWLDEIGHTLVVVVLAFGLTVYLGRELNHSRQCPEIWTRLYGGWLFSAAVLVANSLLGASLPRWIVASVAELCLAWLILYSVPSGILRAIWEHRWKEQLRSVTKGLGPHEDYPIQPFWLISLWADVLKVTFLLLVLFFAEDGHRMVVGFWPVCCAVIASWIYLNCVVTWVIGRLAPAAQAPDTVQCRSSRGLRRTMPGPSGPYQDYPGDVHELARRMKEQLAKVEPLLSRVDKLMWAAICILALPFGLRVLPLFLFSAIPAFSEVLAASSRQMGRAGWDAGQGTKEQLGVAALASYVRQILSLMSTPKDREAKRWRSQIWGLLYWALFVGLVHTLSVHWGMFAAWTSHRSSVLAMSGWGNHLHLPGGGIGFGLLSYVALLAVLLWRMMDRYQEQATELEKQVQRAETAQKDLQRANEDLRRANGETNKARLRAEEALEESRNSLTIAEGAKRQAEEAYQAANDVNRAVATALHNLKNDAWLLAEPLERGLHMSPLDPPRWLDLSRALLMTWLVSENHEVPVSFSRVCRSTDVQVPPPDAALVLTYQDVMSDIVEIMLKGYTVGEGSPWYTELWEAKCSSLGQHLADADLPRQTHCALVAALKQAREDPRCPLADPTQLSAVRTALGEYVGKHVLSWGQGVEAAYQVNFEGVEEEVRERVRYGVVSCLRSALRELTRNAFAAAVAAPEFALQFVVRESEGQMHFRVANAGELGETGKLASGRDAVERFSKLTRASLFIPPTQVSSEAAAATDATLAICLSPGCQGPDAWVVSGLSYRLEQNNAH